MEGSGKDEVVVCTDLVEAVVEVLVVDQATGLVDDDEGKDSPMEGRGSHKVRARRSESHATALSILTWCRVWRMAHQRSNIRFHLALEAHRSIDERTINYPEVRRGATVSQLSAH